MTTTIEQQPETEEHIVQPVPGTNLCAVCHRPIARVHHSSPWVHAEIDDPSQ
jgi:hypothetical protein